MSVITISIIINLDLYPRFYISSRTIYLTANVPIHFPSFQTLSKPELIIESPQTTLNPIFPQ